MTDIYVTDMKLAAILVSLGVKRRASDPVTCDITYPNNVKTSQFKFWFECNEPSKEEEAIGFIKAYNKARNWEEFALDKEHPLYWMKGVLENRESYLSEIKHNVQPVKIINVGNKTLLISERASEELKNKFKKLI